MMIIKIIGRRFHLSEKAPFQTHTSCWLKEMVKVWKKTTSVSFLLLCYFPPLSLVSLVVTQLRLEREFGKKQNKATLEGGRDEDL